MEKFNFTINGNKYDTEIVSIDEKNAQILVNGVAYSVEIETEKTKIASPIRPIATHRQTGNTPSQPIQRQQKATTDANAITAPLPGVIIDVKVNVGDSVTEGQHLLTLEAMKMENNIDAPKSGTVKSISKQKGDSVMEGDTLIVIE